MSSAAHGPSLRTGELQAPSHESSPHTHAGESEPNLLWMAMHMLWQEPVWRNWERERGFLEGNLGAQVIEAAFVARCWLCSAKPPCECVPLAVLGEFIWNRADFIEFWISRRIWGEFEGNLRWFWGDFMVSNWVIVCVLSFRRRIKLPGVPSLRNQIGSPQRCCCCCQSPRIFTLFCCADELTTVRKENCIAGCRGLPLAAGVRA